MISDQEGGLNEHAAAVLEQFQIKLHLKAKGQHAAMIERHNELLRRQIHLTDQQATNDGLRVSFTQILNEALFAKNVLLQYGGFSPYEALYGRTPPLLDVMSIGEERRGEERKGEERRGKERGDRREERGERRGKERGDRREETGERREERGKERGDRREETGERRQETGERRQERGERREERRGKERGDRREERGDRREERKGEERRGKERGDRREERGDRRERRGAIGLDMLTILF